MAHPKEEITTQPNYAFEFDQTIVFLRPLNNDAIAVLNAADNRPYRVEVDPPEKPSDQQPRDISDREVTSPGESESGCNPPFPSVLRLGFDSIEPPSLAGFTFGGLSECNFKLPLSPAEIGFTIHYVFKSGALMVTAGTGRITVGDSLIEKRQSLLLMHNTILTCETMKFSVEFPEMKDRLQAHKANYQHYSKRLQVNNARYMQLSHLDTLSIKHYKSTAVLGKGGFGTVHLAINSKTGRSVAMKLITNSETSDMKEIETMRNLHHDHIIQYYDSFLISNGQLCILMELAVNDLYAHINAKQEKCISLDGICSIATQALLALKYLHGKNITHRDIKPPNILVTKWDQATDHLTIKLCDFGLASQGSRLHTRCGTDNFMAPEVKNAPLEKDGRLTFPYTKAVDIWAMGKVLRNLVRDNLTRLQYTDKKQYANARSLITKMMSWDPTKRPTAAECLQFPWLQQQDDCKDRGPQKRKASFELTNGQTKKPGLRP